MITTQGSPAERQIGPPRGPTEPAVTRYGRRTPASPERAGSSKVSRRTRGSRRGRGGERGLRCRACHRPVTAAEHARAIAGRTVHRRSNPAGIEFEFGCFAAAPGAVPVGENTTEHSWFDGYTWCFAMCLGCGAHLGWFYSGGGESFVGLILNRLTEAPREGEVP